MTDTSTRRMTGLDGLRGLAALVVVLYHASKIAVPELSPAASRVYDGLADSPVKLAFAGTEAVLVFFVLSGLVVALPALGAEHRWRAYYAARLTRLYLPVWGALLFAAALIVLVPRDPSTASPGGWLRTGNASELRWDRLLAEASLWPASYDIDNVLWSLRWELIFSLALPAFVAAAIALRRRAALVALAAVLLSIAGRVTGLDALVYLPVFLAGVLIATRVDELRRWGSARPDWFWATCTIGSAALLICGWLARPVVDPGSTAGRALWGAAAAGAVGLVVAVVGWPKADRALSHRLPEWLGKVSFSLYLVHVPVLATLAYLWGEAAWPAVAAVGIPASLLTAELFRRLVERPSHRLARRIRRTLSRDGAQRVEAPSPSER